MMQFLARFFSDKYVNHAAIGGNHLLLLMYRFSFPFSYILNKLRFTPNQITSLSTAFAILAAICLVYHLDSQWFVIFWAISLLLDFCDGTVARMTDNISKTALRYDHVSDLFKLFIIMLATGVHYNGLWGWILVMTASFSFMYYDVLNHELSSAQKSLDNMEKIPWEQSDNVIDKKVGKFNFIKKLIKNAFLLKLLKNTYTALTTINGHTLLLFLLIPLGFKITIVAFCYFIIISVLGIVARISELRKIPRKALAK